jgi:hypothetical protein
MVIFTNDYNEKELKALLLQEKLQDEFYSDMLNAYDEVIEEC